MGQYLVSHQEEANECEKKKITSRKPIQKRKAENKVIASSKLPKIKHDDSDNASPSLNIAKFIGSGFQLKFVNRKKEANMMVRTLAMNRGATLRDAKLVSLFQTCGIGKTSLVQQFRQVYEENHFAWDESTSFVRDLKLLVVDLRFCAPTNTVDEHIRKCVLNAFRNQFVNDLSNSQELMRLRRKFYDELLEYSTAYDMLSHFDSVQAPEGYLVFFDEVDRLCEQENYSKPLEILFNAVAPLVVGKRSSVILSGHSPIQYQFQEDNICKFGYEMIFLPPIDEDNLKLILEETKVNLGGNFTSLSHALSLLGLKDEQLFISLLKKYTGTVPRIMRNVFINILSNQTSLETTEQIETVLKNRVCQKSTDITVHISSLEQAEIVSKLNTLYCLGQSIPVSEKVQFNGKERFLIELLPVFLIHFYVRDDIIYLNIPKILQLSLLALNKYFRN